MARFGCLALAVIIALALLIFIVFLWSGWLNRPVGHTPAALGIAYAAPASAAARLAPEAQPHWGDNRAFQLCTSFRT